MPLPTRIRVTKHLKPNPPGLLTPNQIPTAVVGGADSVPVEIQFQGIEGTVLGGVYLVLLIDNSGSMGNNDPSHRRFHAISDLISAFAPERDELDRIALYLFYGSQAHQVQTWKKWSQTQATIDDLLNSNLVPPTPSWNTPMAHGMYSVNQLLATVPDAFFKMVVLLSDGDPTSDIYTGIPGTPIEACYGLAAEAFQSQILYSTIYLTNYVPPDDNSLLERIAKSTDFITNYASDAEYARYYFRITSADGIVAAYRSLLDEVVKRAWPRDALIREEIGSGLSMDEEATASFVATDGFTLDNSIVDFGDTGAATLSEALGKFKSTGTFQIRINELDGTATLRFSVKLDNEAISPAAFPDPEKVCLHVDRDVDTSPYLSYVTYLQPTGSVDASRVTDPLPDAMICFRKGLSVSKRHDQLTSPERIEIQIVNLDLNPIDWVQVAEFPSGALNTQAIADDFHFRPWSMLVRTRLIAWWADYVASRTGRDLGQVQEELRSSYGSILESLEPELGPCICQFHFVDNYPLGIEEFWRTPSQRGLYKLRQHLGPMETIHLQLHIEDASYRTEQGPPWLSLPVDAFRPVKEWRRSRSSFASSPNIHDWKEIEANPDHMQFTQVAPRPDLFTRTCFSERDVKYLYGLFTGLHPIEDIWRRLDSPDIKPIWQVLRLDSERSAWFGLSVKIYNGGDVSASAHVHARSYVIPVLRPNEAVSIVGHEVQAARPFQAQAESNVSAIDARSSQTFKVQYDSFQYLDDPNEAVTTHARSLVQAALIVSAVDIDGAEAEVLTANNRAIEVVPADPVFIRRPVRPRGFRPPP